MKISEFIVKLLEEQTKHGDITVEVEYDGYTHPPRFDEIRKFNTVYDVDSRTEEVNILTIPTEPRLIIR